MLLTFLLGPVNVIMDVSLMMPRTKDLRLQSHAYLTTGPELGLMLLWWCSESDSSCAAGMRLGATSHGNFIWVHHHGDPVCHIVLVYGHALVTNGCSLNFCH